VAEPSDDDDDDAAPDAPVEIPITGTLDLHPFAPGEVAELVAAYLDECAARAILEVRLIHGKGRGQLARTVRAALARHERVASFRTGREGEGEWGATIVTLIR
jgi:dsDNA-specific endonuclease/ATPase MutS2